MKRIATIVAAAAAMAVGGAWFGGAVQPTEAQVSEGPVIGPIDPNPIKREPLLIYDLSGGTLTGTFHRNVVVYNDGFVAFSRLDNIVFPAPMEVEDVETGFATTLQLKQLAESLKAAGAFEGTDDTQLLLDIPVATITFFPRPATRATANTYSFYSGGGSDIEVIINDFVDIVLGM